MRHPVWKKNVSQNTPWDTRPSLAIKLLSTLAVTRANKWDNKILHIAEGSKQISAHFLDFPHGPSHPQAPFAIVTQRLRLTKCYVQQDSQSNAYERSLHTTRDGSQKLHCWRNLAEQRSPTIKLSHFATNRLAASAACCRLDSLLELEFSLMRPPYEYEWWEGERLPACLPRRTSPCTRRRHREQAWVWPANKHDDMRHLAYLG